MRRPLLALVVLVAATVVVHAPAAGATSKRTVVASFYPLAYAAQQVGGARVAVTNLTPAGAEPHDLELSPAQMDRLLDADLAVVLGEGFQPAVEKAADGRDGVTVRILRAHTDDPHVWLDPVRMQGIVRDIQRGLTRADPAGRQTYARNASTLIGRLDALDQQFRAGLADCDRNLLVTSHEAFGHLAARYGLRQEGVAGIDPSAEPDARRVGELADLVRRDHVTTVFTEALVSPRVADTLAREAGVTTETLDPLEGLTDRARAAGADYFSVMTTNLDKLRAALGCR